MGGRKELLLCYKGIGLEQVEKFSRLLLLMDSFFGLYYQKLNCYLTFFLRLIMTIKLAFLSSVWLKMTRLYTVSVLYKDMSERHSVLHVFIFIV